MTSPGKPHLEAAPPPDTVVFVIDDDADLRDALENLFASAGFRVATFGSADAFLASPDLPDLPSCLVLDIRLPGINGLDFYDQYRASESAVPVVFMTGHGDIAMSVRAMKAGAVDFLAKPFLEEDMLEAVAAAIDRSRRQRERAQEMSDLRSRYGQLTVREAEILGFVVSGLLNKQIAAAMGLAEITVKVHRASMMRKMGASSFIELLRLVQMLDSLETR